MTEICLRRCFFVEITICIGSSCHLHGSRDVIQVLEKLVTAHGLTDKVELKGSFCMGECTKGGVCVQIGRAHV